MAPELPPPPPLGGVKTLLTALEAAPVATPAPIELIMVGAAAAARTGGMVASPIVD
jgi:hypothetical protein